jgi:hypothetical protein
LCIEELSMLGELRTPQFKKCYFNLIRYVYWGNMNEEVKGLE